MTESEAIRNSQEIADAIFEANEEDIVRGFEDAANRLGIPWDTKILALLVTAYKVGVIDLGRFSCLRNKGP